MQFPTEGLCHDHFARLAAMPAPRVEYCIYFTPRSGSSWLTDLATRSGFLGSPRECFNPRFAPDMAQALNAATMEGYATALRRRFNHRGAFGVEVTLYQINRMFADASQFMAHFGAAKPLWLIREDIVLQAVSLWKMQATGVAHSVGRGSGHLRPEEPAYDAESISHWLRHLARLEALTEAHFEAFDLRPVRLSYERMMAAGPRRMRRFLAKVLGIDPVTPQRGDPVHQKLGTSRNDDYAKRFRLAEPGMCERLDRDRAAMLARLDMEWAKTDGGP